MELKFVIKYISIKDFRCFDNLETDLWSKTTITAANECGKSSVASAILWCLTGKNIEGNSTFEIVPIGKYGEVSPAVTLECIIDDRPVALKREYKAKFTRDKKFSDYAVTTYINGIETGVRKFQEWVSKNICDEQVFKILSNPKTFIEDCPKEAKELTWQAQRRLLMSIIGESKTDLEIAESEEKFKLIVEPLKRYDSATQYLLFLKKQYSEIQKEMDLFETKIEQQEKNISEIKHSDSEIEELVNKTKQDAAKLNAENEAFKNSGKSQKANEIKTQITALAKEKENILSKYNEDMIVFNRTKETYQKEAQEFKEKCEKGLETIRTYSNALERLKAKVVVEVCPTCGQKLQRFAIENAKKKIETRIKNGEYKTAQESRNVAEYKKKYEELSAKASNIMEPVYPSKAIEIQSKIDSLMEEVCNVPEAVNMPGYEENLKILEKTMDELKIEFILSQKNKEIEAEIEKIEANHKENVLKMSNIQRGIDLTKDFISLKCSMAEESINSNFENVKFQLFEKNKSNDEIKETCILKFKGIKYQDLSYSTKVIAAIEVVKAFQKFYNSYVPIVIDNFESVAGEVETNAQTLFMIVKEENCPKCNGHSGRRNSDGTWTCKKCGHVWKKTLEIKEM